MKQKAYIKPTKPALLIGIIASAAMLVFGIFFFAILNEDGGEIGRVFLVFWFIVVLVIGGSFLYSYKNYDKKSSSILAEEIEMPDSLLSTQNTHSFDDKLRKLEALKTEGIISDEEYNAKRKEIMNEKW